MENYNSNINPNSDIYSNKKFSDKKDKQPYN